MLDATIRTSAHLAKFVWLSSKPYQTQTNKRFDSLVNVNVFMNMVQVNYVLAGISNGLSHRIKDAVSGQPDEKKYAWDNLISSKTFMVSVSGAQRS